MNNAIVMLQGKVKKKDTLVLAYKTLGVVFGGLVTSPLYVYPSMPLKSPTEEDYLGIYSIMFWTLTLIGLVKYANIAIKADDHGEGTLLTISVAPTLLIESILTLICDYIQLIYYSKLL